MSVVRLYHSAVICSGDIVKLDRPNSRRLVKVRRFSVGDTCVLFNNQGEFMARLVVASEFSSELIVEHCLKQAQVPDFQVNIMHAMLRAKKLDLVVQKASELGAYSLLPVATERSQTKQYNTQRAQKIADAAAEQCQRNQVLEVREVCNWQDLFKLPPADLRLLAHHPSLSDDVPMVDMHEIIPPQAKPFTIDWLIGAEGGFSEEELRLAIQCGFIGVQLSEYILRTETVALVALAVTDYWWREKRANFRGVS